jgi:hypothetical protein
MPAYRRSSPASSTAQKTRATAVARVSNNYPGDVLLSQGAAPQVPSALVVLTSVFGMGTGVAPPLWSPGTLLYLY